MILEQDEALVDVEIAVDARNQDFDEGFDNDETMVKRVYGTLDHTEFFEKTSI